MKLVNWLGAGLFILAVSPVFAQTPVFSDKQIKEWSRNPEWVTMMDDSTANYYAVVTAFESFWKDRELPVEEDQIFRAPREEKEQRGFLRKLFKSKEEKDKENRNKFQFAVKKYRHWKLTVEPYVQEDGRILTKMERLDIWKNSR